MKYRAKKGFICRNIGKGHVIIAIGDAARDFKGMVRLNTVGAEIWKMLEDGWCEEETIVQNLVSRCKGAEESRVREDVSSFLKDVRLIIDEAM